uniref:PAP_central domain-containing protein n=1 Tax=Globodera pallida TaxID=36090 RepID=A0A183CM65_GLOPA
MLLKKVEAMNIVLKQQQIGNPIICESNQYNLIRTNPANRQNDVHLSNGKWVKKVANFKQPLLLTNGSHLMSSDLDSSDLDLICVVPDQIHLFIFYGENDTTLYSMLRKELIDAKLSWIAGKVPLIRIEFGQIEVDLLLVPLPIKYLTGKAAASKLESDQSIKVWAKNRLIYSGIFGYFNGATLAVM